MAVGSESKSLHTGCSACWWFKHWHDDHPPDFYYVMAVLATFYNTQADQIRQSSTRNQPAMLYRLALSATSWEMSSLINNASVRIRVRNTAVHLAHHTNSVRHPAHSIPGSDTALLTLRLRLPFKASHGSGNNHPHRSGRSVLQNVAAKYNCRFRVCCN